MGDAPGLGISRRKIKALVNALILLQIWWQGLLHWRDRLCAQIFQVLKTRPPAKPGCHKNEREMPCISTWKNMEEKNVSLRVEMGSLCWSKDIYRRHAHCFAVCTRVGILRLRIQLSCSWRRDRTNPFPKQASLCSKPHHSLCISQHRFCWDEHWGPGSSRTVCRGQLVDESFQVSDDRSCILTIHHFKSTPVITKALEFKASRLWTLFLNLTSTCQNWHLFISCRGRFYPFTLPY